VSRTAHDVIVVAEHRDGALAPTTLELVRLGRTLAKEVGSTVKVALFGHGTEALAARVAAYSEVAVVDDPALREYTAYGYLQALRGVTQGTEPLAVLLAHSSQGFDLAPLVAMTWTRATAPTGWPPDVERASLVANCLDVVDTGAGAFLATRRIFNDKLVMSVTVTWPFVATVRPASLEPADPLPSPASITKVPVPIDGSRIRTRVVRYERPEVKDIDIASAEVVVAAGRGIQKKENLALVERLAKRLGGVVGASRPLTDMEWLPKTRQVGQSGKTVRPKLYVACGISGAMQHVSGMKDADLIVAINTDPSAPIFEVAHVGIVANVLDLIPAVLNELGG
jgi:electron transfer flavoprotein alpha subunit